MPSGELQADKMAPAQNSWKNSLLIAVSLIKISRLLISESWIFHDAVLRTPISLMLIFLSVAG